MAGVEKSLAVEGERLEQAVRDLASLKDRAGEQLTGGQGDFDKFRNSLRKLSANVETGRAMIASLEPLFGEARKKLGAARERLHLDLVQLCQAAQVAVEKDMAEAFSEVVKIHDSFLAARTGLFASYRMQYPLSIGPRLRHGRMHGLGGAPPRLTLTAPPPAPAPAAEPTPPDAQATGFPAVEPAQEARSSWNSPVGHPQAEIVASLGAGRCLLATALDPVPADVGEGGKTKVPQNSAEAVETRVELAHVANLMQGDKQPVQQNSAEREPVNTRQELAHVDGAATPAGQPVGQVDQQKTRVGDVSQAQPA
jgi:hypothetical protein